MTRYAVGDLQGCLHPLRCLLERVAFDPDRDQLWLVGDLINRGPQSLETLRFVQELGDCTRIVLGNHDLHFLAVAMGATPSGKSDTFGEILRAKDRATHIEWLLQQPLFYSDPDRDFHMVHAGIPPQWDLATAHRLSREVENSLQGQHPESFLKHMYGDKPALWRDDLQGFERLRVITNYFTRMRFCSAEGELDLNNKLLSSDRPGFAPWFAHPLRKTANDPILFGHWAALEGNVNTPNVYALDTGCVWGRAMTLMNLEDKTLEQCAC